MGWDPEAIFYIEIGEARPLGITGAINKRIRNTRVPLR